MKAEAVVLAVLVLVQLAGTAGMVARYFGW